MGMQVLTHLIIVRITTRTRVGLILVLCSSHRFIAEETAQDDQLAALPRQVERHATQLCLVKAAQWIFSSAFVAVSKLYCTIRLSSTEAIAIRPPRELKMLNIMSLIKSACCPFNFFKTSLKTAGHSQSGGTVQADHWPARSSLQFAVNKKCLIPRYNSGVLCNIWLNAVWVKEK